MKAIFDFKKVFSKFNSEKGNKLLILLLIGILLLVIAWPTGGSSTKNNDTTVDTYNADATEAGEAVLEAYIANQEARLTAIVGAIDGAGEVSVMITAKSSSELVVEKDVTSSSSDLEESDSSGGNRTTNEVNHSETTVFTDDGTGGSVPYVVKELEPQIEGIVVAAQGGGDLNVVREITDAIGVLFDVPVHKIKVVKMNSN